MADMKKSIYLLVCFIAPVLIMGQTGTPVIKGYAWLQSTARGAKPTAVASEAGNTGSTPTRSSGRYYLYLESRNGQNILPFRIWINGVPHRVTNEIMTNTPVTKSRPDVTGITQYDTLVAATKHKVTLVNPAATIRELTITPLPGVKAASEQGKVVVEYYWKAKRYAYTIPEIKILEAVRLQ
jgi:hypothetical protein